jgi:hypothetical protein
MEYQARYVRSNNNCATYSGTLSNISISPSGCAAFENGAEMLYIRRSCSNEIVRPYHRA